MIHKPAHAPAVWPRAPLSTWIANASADLLWHGPATLPVSRAHRQRASDATYLTAPRTAWCDYPAAELHRRGAHRAATVVSGLGQCLAGLGVDRMIFIGNYPVSTSDWPAETFPALADAAEDMGRAYPDYFIGVRNILPHRHGALQQQLEAAGFLALPARVVYEFDCTVPPAKLPAHLRRDNKALRTSGLQSVIRNRLSPADLARIHALYGRIYLDKHSQFNAQYHPAFFRDHLDAGVMQCLLLNTAHGEIAAFALLCEQASTLTVPALGYDPQTPVAGLYRLLFAAIYDVAQQRRIRLNYSSGAGDFKRKRGGCPHLEWTYVRAPRRSGKALRWLLAALSRRAGRVPLAQWLHHGA